MSLKLAMKVLFLVFGIDMFLAHHIDFILLEHRVS